MSFSADISEPGCPVVYGEGIKLSQLYLPNLLNLLDMSNPMVIEILERNKREVALNDKLVLEKRLSNIDYRTHKWTGEYCKFCDYPLKAVIETNFTFCSNHESLCGYEQESEFYVARSSD